MAYPTPTNNDTAGLTAFFQYISVVTDGLFFPLILFVLWVVIFMAVKQYRTPVAFTTASAVCAFLSIPLAVAQVLNPWFMYISIFLASAGILWLKLDK